MRTWAGPIPWGVGALPTPWGVVGRVPLVSRGHHGRNCPQPWPGGRRPAVTQMICVTGPDGVHGPRGRLPPCACMMHARDASGGRRPRPSGAPPAVTELVSATGPDGRRTVRRCQPVPPHLVTGQ